MKPTNLQVARALLSYLDTHSRDRINEGAFVHLDVGDRSTLRFDVDEVHVKSGAIVAKDVIDHDGAGLVGLLRLATRLIIDTDLEFLERDGADAVADCVTHLRSFLAELDSTYDHQPNRERCAACGYQAKDTDQ